MTSQTAATTIPRQKSKATTTNFIVEKREERWLFSLYFVNIFNIPTAGLNKLSF